jgi:RNA polymerase sigma-70 factor, ECF subfamily
MGIEPGEEALPADDWGKRFEEARAHFPQVVLDEASFRAHLDRLGHARPPYFADAYLAAACRSGDASAVRALDEHFISKVRDVARRVDRSETFATELAQQVRIRLLVREGDAAPRIGRYTGEVPLSAWIRVIALRLAFNAKRGAKGGRAESEMEDLAMAEEDPETEYLRAQYREVFKDSFRETLGGLSKDDRTILRLHYVDGVNIDGIGRIFQVHRATVARWLVRIRADVLAGAKRRLAARVGAEADEAESVVAALAGEIDITLSRALGSVTAGGLGEGR